MLAAILLLSNKLFLKTKSNSFITKKKKMSVIVPSTAASYMRTTTAVISTSTTGRYQHHYRVCHYGFYGQRHKPPPLPSTKATYMQQRNYSLAARVRTKLYYQFPFFRGYRPAAGRKKIVILGTGLFVLFRKMIH